MKRSRVIGGGAGVVAVATAIGVSVGAWQGSDAVPADGPAITVYKSASCGCCGRWVEHLRDNGFVVEAVNVRDLMGVKREHGVPLDLTSCHTAIVDGYVIEGHVPAHAIERFLTSPPDGVAGLAVPGMPIGSPGMEGPDPEAYDVLTWSRDGQVDVFESIRP